MLNSVKALNKICSVIPPERVGISVQENVLGRNVLTCSAASYRRWNQRSRRMPGNEWSGALKRFLSPALSFLLPVPLRHIPRAISSLFEVVLGLPAAGLTIAGYCSQSNPLFGLLSFSVSLSLFRKCWTSARTEEAVKSLSIAACLGQTSVPAAVNTSLSGTNADLVSPSTQQMLTVTHKSVFSHTSPGLINNTLSFKEQFLPISQITV